MSMRLIASFLTLIAVFAAWASPARAHPHAFFTTTTEVRYAADGAVTAVRHSWRFDELTSAYFMGDLPARPNGQYTQDELTGIARTQVEALKQVDYYTYIRTGGRRTPAEEFGEAGEYSVEFKDGIMTLNYTVQLKQPLKSKQFTFEVYDPTFYIAFDFAGGTIKLVGAPADCRVNAQRPARSAQTPMSESMFGGNSNYGLMFSSPITVQCP
jgi:ABC-type uncharacterized transport system substrate-binding protein